MPLRDLNPRRVAPDEDLLDALPTELKHHGFSYLHKIFSSMSKLNSKASTTFQDRDTKQFFAADTDEMICSQSFGCC